MDRKPHLTPNSPERWQQAFVRALDENLMIRPGLFGGRFWAVSSRTNPDRVYATDGTICGCLAYLEGNDPVCKHRALWRAVNGCLPDVPAEMPANVRFIHRRPTPQTAA